MKPLFFEGNTWNGGVGWPAHDLWNQTKIPQLWLLTTPHNRKPHSPPEKNGPLKKPRLGCPGKCWDQRLGVRIHKKVGEITHLPNYWSQLPGKRLGLVGYSHMHPHPKNPKHPQKRRHIRSRGVPLEAPKVIFALKRKSCQRRISEMVIFWASLAEKREDFWFCLSSHISNFFSGTSFHR